MILIVINNNDIRIISKKTSEFSKIKSEEDLKSTPPPQKKQVKVMNQMFVFEAVNLYFISLLI